VIITNIVQGQPIDKGLIKAGVQSYLQQQAIVDSYHGRCSDKLANRALKDFGYEQLPFKRFNPNALMF